MHLKKCRNVKKATVVKLAEGWGGCKTNKYAVADSFHRSRLLSNVNDINASNKLKKNVEQAE